MSLTVTSITRINGPTCSHYTVTGNHEGTVRSFQTSQGELDSLIDSFGSEMEAVKALVMLWGAYRQRYGRPIVGVEIA